MEEISQERETR